MQRPFAPAIAAGLVMAIIGTLGWAAGVPWLFPSLGPTIAIQAEASDSPVARAWNVVVGHFIGAAVGFAAVRLSGVIHEPAMNLSHALTPPRVAAASLAVLVSMGLQGLARANHPPAQATTLLVVVGALDADVHGAIVLAAGVLLVAALGEPVRRASLGRRRSD
jgi:hypothetical protein